MRYNVIFTPEAQQQLLDLYKYMAAASSPKIAEHYIDAVITYCESLRDFPHRGTCRDDVRPGLRITDYKKRAVIAFPVAAESVSIIGVFYVGQNYETDLQSELNG